jgi:nitric oxide reductase NorD protein
MSFDEFIYGKLVKYFNNKKVNQDELSRRVLLEEIKPRITVLARALTGEAIEIYPAEREGGYKNIHFFLPVSFELFPSKEENFDLFIFRVVYLSVQKKLGINWKSNSEPSLIMSRLKAVESSEEILSKLKDEFPNSWTMHQRLKELLHQAFHLQNETDLSWLYGKWLVDKDAPTDTALLQNAENTRPGDQSNPTTTLKAKAVEEVVLLNVDKKSQEDYVMTHNFEKVETAEEYDGVWRDFDGSDQLEDHQDALDELQMKYMVRADDTAHSVYHADFSENTTIAESGKLQSAETYVSYHEWDFRKAVFKPDYCKVFPVYPKVTDAGYYQRVISSNYSLLESLRKMLANVNNKRQQIRYQTQGENFDLDMITDMYVDIQNQRTPTEKIYFSSKKAEKDLSILLLLDNSLSTDSFAAGNRVIDVEKEVSILFGEILNEYGIDFSICSFSSHTRNHSTFTQLKTFEQSWLESKNHIGAIEPSGYTRIGASIRHAGSLLKKRPTKNKWLLFISDGKPNDYDTYEGQYGIQDVKQSLRELKELNIQTFALAIEAQARYYLPQMFGSNHYQILTTSHELLLALVKLYSKIKTS